MHKVNLLVRVIVWSEHITLRSAATSGGFRDFAVVAHQQPRSYAHAVIVENGANLSRPRTAKAVRRKFHTQLGAHATLLDTERMLRVDAGRTIGMCSGCRTSADHLLVMLEGPAPPQYCQLAHIDYQTIEHIGFPNMDRRNAADSLLGPHYFEVLSVKNHLPEWRG